MAYIHWRFAASPQISVFLLSSESLPLPPLLSRSLLLWAFELISAGIARCLVGHEAVCKARASSFLFALSFNLLSSPPFPLSHPLIQCTRSLSALPLHSCTPRLLVVWMGMDWGRNTSNWMRTNPVVRGRESLRKQGMKGKNSRTYTKRARRKVQVNKVKRWHERVIKVT